MGQLNKHYRGFVDYRKQTKSDRECKGQREIFRKANDEKDIIETTKLLCTINEDWIEAIEEGLVYVDKAIREERQFIHSIGEVVPIEKAKSVSKSSIEHLARHSDLITRAPEKNSKLIPDKIFVSEKISDFAVYENRFLYLLLITLKDFIEENLKEILKIKNTYHGMLSMNKIIDTEARDVKFNLTLIEDRLDNKYNLQDEKFNKAVNRIEMISSMVASLLATDLMKEVSNAPLIKPPIIKTNPLKMNINLKNSLALYDYIQAYNTDRFTVEEITSKINPFPDDIADEITEIIALSSFLTFAYSNNLMKTLHKEYLEEEKTKKEKEKQKLAEQIRSLKRRIIDEGISPEEYMLLLEKRNRELEKDSAELVEAKKEIIILNNKIASLNKEISDLKTELEEKVQEIIFLNKKYIEDMAKKDALHKLEIENLNEEHKQEIDTINENHQNEIEKLQKEHLEEITLLNNRYDELVQKMERKELEHQEAITNLKEAHEKQLEELKALNDEKTRKLEEEIKETIEKFNLEIASLIEKYELDLKKIIDDKKQSLDLLNEEILKLKEEKQKVINDYEKKLEDKEILHEKAVDESKKVLDEKDTEIKNLDDEKKAILAQLKILKMEKNPITAEDIYTSKEKFDELEVLYEAFTRFFKKQWKLTKKRIREEILKSKK